jgi:hypothetical protein
VGVEARRPLPSSPSNIANIDSIGEFPDIFADRWLAAIFATPVVTGAPDALTTQLALLAFVNGVAIRQCIPRPAVRPIMPMPPRLPIPPIIPIVLIFLIRGRFKACPRPSRKGQAPIQADQYKPRADERHQIMPGVAYGEPGPVPPR